MKAKNCLSVLAILATSVVLGQNGLSLQTSGGFGASVIKEQNLEKFHEKQFGTGNAEFAKAGLGYQFLRVNEATLEVGLAVASLTTTNSLLTSDKAIPVQVVTEYSYLVADLTSRIFILDPFAVKAGFSFMIPGEANRFSNGFKEVIKEPSPAMGFTLGLEINFGAISFSLERLTIGQFNHENQLSLGSTVNSLGMKLHLRSFLKSFKSDSKEIETIKE